MANYVFNPITLQYEVREEPRYAKYVRTGLSIVVAAGLCFLYFWLYTSVLGWDLPKTARLKKENAMWQSKIALAERQLDICEEMLQGIEERDDHVYRSIFGMNVIPDEVKAAKLDPLADALTARINALTKRAYVQSMALDEVYGIALNAGDMVSHIPAVPPILPKKGSYRMASPFGYRTDPVYGGTRFHSGQDFAADVGYPVYVTGDGVVEKVNYGFTGYGNEIIIDHGFGYRTRYAHLSRIDVAKGMKVTRGDQIGAVGKTGKATGPHLHYEVLYKGNAINPYSYMNLDMTVEEYIAMITRRREESGTRKKSTLELLKERGR
ncbi:MAG: M23 family metallopeptidase [Bacteroidales bacterium]|nr:M23 family metallopeptidase [Bacteroidales bacterium]